MSLKKDNLKTMPNTKPLNICTTWLKGVNGTLVLVINQPSDLRETGYISVEIVETITG